METEYFNISVFFGINDFAEDEDDAKQRNNMLYLQNVFSKLINKYSEKYYNKYSNGSTIGFKISKLKEEIDHWFVYVCNIYGHSDVFDHHDDKELKYKFINDIYKSIRFSEKVKNNLYILDIIC